MLPSFVGMIFIGLMCLLVFGIYWRYGRHIFQEAVLEGNQRGTTDIRQYFSEVSDYGEENDNNLDKTMIRGLEETVLFHPQEKENDVVREQMQNTLVLPLTEPNVGENELDENLSDGIETEETVLLQGSQSAATSAANINSFSERNEKEEKSFAGVVKNQPQPFGSQTCWLAIHAKNMKEVAEVLEIENRHSCNWQDGLSASQQNDGTVFVTPVIGEWVLVIGRSILKKIGLDYPIDSFKWMKEVSEQFGLVYYFCTHEKAQYHAWIKADQGEIERAYAYSGKENEVFWEWGDITDTEKTMFQSLETYYGNQIVDEAVVLALAAKWTVDTSFKNTKNVNGSGILGKLE